MTEPLLLLSKQYNLSPDDLNVKIGQGKSLSLTSGIQYSHSQYYKPVHWDIDDMGVVAYQKEKESESANFIQIAYCLIAENEFQLKAKAKKNLANEKIDIINIVFTETFLSQFAGAQKVKTLSDSILSFEEENSFVKTTQLCNKTKQVLQSIKENTYSHGLESIFLHAQIQMLLLYSLEDCLSSENEEHFVCKFLSNEVDKEKIFKAKEILIQRIGNPITIKELSKKVAMNECYLKKGFKEITGSTIFEFYQNKRMEYAKMMLCDKGLNVTEVSDLLGYSSISHFSTAFKKHTGIKPCELLAISY